MPKIKPSKPCHLRKIVSEFGENVFSTDGIILFCKLCETKVSADKRFTVIQHIGRDKHKRAAELAKKKREGSQLLLAESSSVVLSKKPFYKELCEAFVSANIPLEKLNNPRFCQFLEKYTCHVIPDESTLRKNYIDDCFRETIEKIREIVKGKKILVSIDETNDADGRHVCNVLIGTLDPDMPGKIFLLNVDELEKVNHSSICQLFEKSLNILWPNGIRHNDVLLFLSDAAPYMVKAGKSIKGFYPKLVHVTCLAHALHRLAEEIRANYPDVDKLVSNIKKMFLKAPYRIQCFKSQAPNLALPPKPVITRWGTWLDACMYYSDNFQTVKSIVNSFDADDAASIQIAQNVFSTDKIEGNLAYIRSNFRIITSTIKSLQEQNMELVDAINCIDKVGDILKSVKGKVASAAFAKFSTLLAKNYGFQTMKKISLILTGEANSFDTEEELTISDAVFFKYAPITAVDVERSFSRYKNLHTENRRSFTFENIKKHLIIQCNYNALM